MTKQAKQALSFAAALPPAAAVMFFLINTAFVSHRDLAPVTAAVDSLRGAAIVSSQATRALGEKLDRVLCYAEAQSGTRPVSDCVR